MSSDDGSLAHDVQLALAVGDEKLRQGHLEVAAVTDPRAGALVDVMRNAGEPFNRHSGLEPVIRWEWYPPEFRETVHAILDAERVATSASSGTGWEG